jgi:hypothetical protein
VLFLALGAHLSSQPYESHVTSTTLGTSRHMHRRRMYSSSRDSLERGSYAPPRGRRRSTQEEEHAAKQAERAIFNTRFSWDRPEHGRFSSDLVRPSSDNLFSDIEHRRRASSNTGRDTRSSDEGSLIGPRHNLSTCIYLSRF